MTCDYPLISVIVSTYNRPDALRFVLLTLCEQNDRNYEVIVADDGSGSETGEIVREVAQNNPDIPIFQVWQEDLGFRLAQIRNAAVKQARGEYLIFIDGDCLVPESFVAKHRRLSEPGWFVVGQRILASENFTKCLLGAPSVRFRFPSFWRLLRLWMSGNVNRFFPTLPFPLGWFRKLRPLAWDRVRGCNMGIWRKDYERVNGFDETFQSWGAEDNDIAVRLINSGVYLKFGHQFSWVLHLWHPTSSRNNRNRNFDVVLERIRQKTILPIRGMRS